jgi:hypothetical protein
MKPYEEVCFPSGIIRWTRENNLYVCRLTEDQMNEIKEIHEKPWVGLTDDEIAQLMFKCDVIVTGPTQFNFAHAIEAKLKEKNNG